MSNINNDVIYLLLCTIQELETLYNKHVGKDVLMSIMEGTCKNFWNDITCFGSIPEGSINFDSLFECADDYVIMSKENNSKFYSYKCTDEGKLFANDYEYHKSLMFPNEVSKFKQCPCDGDPQKCNNYNPQNIELAKELLIKWLRIEQENNEQTDYKCLYYENGFVGTFFSFDKRAKFFKDYPVVECDIYDSVKNVWDDKYKNIDSIYDDNKYCSPSPTYKWCEKNSLVPIYSFDIAISQDDRLKYGILIVDKHQKCQGMRTFTSDTCLKNNADGNNFTTISFDANWILSQKEKPDVLKPCTHDSFYGRPYSHSDFFEYREPFKNIQGITNLIKILKQDIHDEINKNNIGPNYNTNDNNISNVKNKKYKKEKIPSTLRALVWNTYIGKGEGKGLCYVCGKEEITPFNFECGHIIAESKGGKTNLDNLRPVTKICNQSVGTENMDDFKKK